jgi:hypothetical protein
MILHKTMFETVSIKWTPGKQPLVDVVVEVVGAEAALQ